MKAFLHVGAGKTGTSAIQVALARHRDELASAGIFYPAADPGLIQRTAKGKISSGNAVELARLMAPKIRPSHFDELKIWTWLEESVRDAKGRDLLFSSELMQSGAPQQVGETMRFFIAKGYQPVVILYVRHLLDHAVSVYLQHLKQGFATLQNRDRFPSIGDFIRSYRCPFLKTLNTYTSILQAEHIVTRLYDSERDRLIPGFFSLLTEKVQVDARPSEIFNRSPTPAEQIVFERLATFPNAQKLCSTLANMVLNRPSSSEEPLVIQEDEFQAFSRNNSAIVQQLNGRFMRPEDRLLLKSEVILIGHARHPAPEEVYSAFAEFLATVVDQNLPGRRR